MPLSLQTKSASFTFVLQAGDTSQLFYRVVAVTSLLFSCVKVLDLRSDQHYYTLSHFYHYNLNKYPYSVFHPKTQHILECKKEEITPYLLYSALHLPYLLCNAPKHSTVEQKRQSIWHFVDMKMVVKTVAIYQTHIGLLGRNKTNYFRRGPNVCGFPKN